MTFIENSLNRETVENIKRDKLPVIIFGAGVVGEVLFHACRKAGVEVECFCDNNINKVKSTLCGANVVHTRDLKTKYQEAHFIISAADIKDVVDQLDALGFTKWHPSSLLLRNFDIYQYQFSAQMDFVEFAVSTCLLCHDNYLDSDKLFMRSVDLIITERCSLKCINCSNLMQYYKKPKDCDTNEMMRSIDVFCSLIDEVNEFRIIGGEPFMNKEIHLIVKRLFDEPKVRRIVIYTNGTIVPREDQIEYFKNNKVLFIITDYGTLSKKLNTLTQLLQQNNIAYYILKVEGWSDCSKIVRHYRNTKQQKKVFTSCCAKNLVTLSNGKLYRCPFAANADRLRAVPDFENNYVDIFQKSSKDASINEMKRKIKFFLLEKDFLEVCDYCNGRPLEAPADITPAVQTDEPLEYEQCC